MRSIKLQLGAARLPAGNLTQEKLGSAQNWAIVTLKVEHQFKVSDSPSKQDAVLRLSMDFAWDMTDHFEKATSLGETRMILCFPLVLMCPYLSPLRGLQCFSRPAGGILLKCHLVHLTGGGPELH